MRKLLKTLMILFTATIFAPSSHAAAPDIAPQPCDTQYWEQMSARAWMSAEQEIMMNKTLIFKGDSVLELVCFDQFLKLNAWEGGDIFTHTDYFGQAIVPREANESLNKSIQAVVYNALMQYIDGSFGHDYLSGRASHMSASSTDQSFQPPTEGLAGGYVCQTMNHMHEASMCSNFVDNSNFENTDGFYPFERIKGHNGTPDVAGYDSILETRKWPPSMSCVKTVSTPGGPETVSSLGPAGSWFDQIQLATNADDNLYPFSEPLAAIYEEVGDKLEPGNCNTNAPIKTGIKVYVSEDESYDDAVCTNPGCVYNKTGNCINPPVTGSGSLVTDDDETSGGAG